MVVSAEDILDSLNVNLTAATETALNNNVGTGDFVVTIIIYFLVLGLIIGGFVYFRKYWLNRVAGIKSGSNMIIKDRLIIAQDKQIILLEVGGKILMVGISAQSMTALGEFKKDDLHDDGEAVTDENRKDSFFGILSDRIKTNFDKNK